MENNMKVTQIAESIITIRFSDSASGYILSNVENKDPKRYLYTQVHSSIIYSSQKLKQLKCSMNAEWINEMCYIHTRVYYSILQRKEVLTPAPTMDEP